MTNDDEIIAPSHNQLFRPRAAEIGESNGSDLNQMVWRCFSESVKVCSFSLVTQASICNCILEICVCVSEIGSKRFNMVRSAKFLNAQIRRTGGTSNSSLWLRKMISRIMEIKGVMPLPPLTITKDSCLVPNKYQSY